MKICIMGNSHLAALKLAWQQLSAEYSSIELVFFGARASAMAHLDVQNNCLVSTHPETEHDMQFTSGGQNAIDLSSFDAVWLYGLACDVNLFIPTLTTHQLESLTDINRKFLSRACFTQLCRDRLQHGILYKLTRLVRQISDLPVYVSPSPFPSRTCVDDPSEKWNALSANDGSVIQSSYYDGIITALNDYNTVFIPQPNDSIVDFLFTAPQYAKDSIRLTEGLSTKHAHDDYVHMNQAYGVLFLQQAILTIATQHNKTVHPHTTEKPIRLLSITESISAVDHFLIHQKAHQPSHQHIPRVLFQYWDQNPPAQVLSLLQRNRSLCEQHGIEYRLFNDEEARKLLKTHFSANTYRAYDLAPHPAMQCDLFRLCYLYQFGGYYLDADMVLTKQGHELFTIKGELAVFKWTTKATNGICNWLIGGIPESPILKFAVETTTTSILNACHKPKANILKNTLAISGPTLFTRVIGSYIAHHQAAHLPYCIETVTYAQLLVQNGRCYLKKPLGYKKTARHWSIAANEPADSAGLSNTKPSNLSGNPLKKIANLLKIISFNKNSSS